MSPSPKTPEENNSPDDETSSTTELSHPSFHMQHEYIASTDESVPNSDDETNNTNDQMGNFNGYCLLPQDSDMNQQEEQYESDNEDEEFIRFATLRAVSSIEENPTSNPPANPTESIWSTKLESESFPVDDDKANYIKSLMSKIELPESSIPVWAQLCSEQDWQEKLRERITCRQTTFFSNEQN